MGWKDIHIEITNCVFQNIFFDTPSFFITNKDKNTNQGQVTIDRQLTIYSIQFSNFKKHLRTNSTKPITYDQYFFGLGLSLSLLEKYNLPCLPKK